MIIGQGLVGPQLFSLQNASLKRIIFLLYKNSAAKRLIKGDFCNFCLNHRVTKTDKLVILTKEKSYFDFQFASSVCSSTFLSGISPVESRDF
jgi:hypothetical protein